jgi:hypothetical protein
MRAIAGFRRRARVVILGTYANRGLRTFTAENRVTYETKNVNGEIWYTQYDSAGLYVINHDMAMSLQRRVTIRTTMTAAGTTAYLRMDVDRYHR